MLSPLHTRHSSSHTNMLHMCTVSLCEVRNEDEIVGAPRQGHVFKWSDCDPAKDLLVPSIESKACWKQAGKTATMLPMEIHFCKKDLEMKFTETFVADKNKENIAEFEKKYTKNGKKNIQQKNKWSRCTCTWCSFLFFNIARWNQQSVSLMWALNSQHKTLFNLSKLVRYTRLKKIV